MKLLLEGIISIIKDEQQSNDTDPTGEGLLVGLHGPFFERVPEKGSTPLAEFPYVVIGVIPGNNKWNFGSNYQEACTVTMTVYSDGFLDAVGWSDVLAAIFDKNRFNIAPDKILIALRDEAARPRKEPIYNAASGKAIYSSALNFKYNVQRAL